VRADHWLFSTGARLSLIFSGLVIASFALAITLTWLSAESAAESELRQRIGLESRAVAGEYQDEGAAAAAAAIDARAERPGALEYWLEDRNGKRLAGDLPQMSTPDGWHYVKLAPSLPGAEDREKMLVLSTTLGDGARLSVGEDLERADAVRGAVLRQLLWIGVLAVVLAIAAGLLATRRSLAQMEALRETLGEVTAGRLGARFRPRGGRPNDLDQLGLGVNRMLDHIDGLVQSLRRVSSDLAHELRTPLAHVQQRLEQVQAAAGEADRQQAVERAEAEIGKVLSAFDAILRLAEIEAGAARSRFVEVDLAALCERVHDAYAPDVEAAGCTLEVAAAAPGRIPGDAELLAQALANLIENAMRHAGAAARITLGVAAAGEELRLEVRDTGPGIEAEQR